MKTDSVLFGRRTDCDGVYPRETLRLLAVSQGESLVQSNARAISTRDGCARAMLHGESVQLLQRHNQQEQIANGIAADLHGFRPQLWSRRRSMIAVRLCVYRGSHGSSPQGTCDGVVCSEERVCGGYRLLVLGSCTDDQREVVGQSIALTRALTERCPRIGCHPPGQCRSMMCRAGRRSLTRGCHSVTSLIVATSHRS